MQDIIDPAMLFQKFDGLVAMGTVWGKKDMQPTVLAPIDLHRWRDGLLDELEPRERYAENDGERNTEAKQRQYRH